MIFFDERWSGDHGIGRFSRVLGTRLHMSGLALQGKPSSPLDPLFLGWALRRLGAADIFFSPGYNAPFFCRSPFFFTIHDLNHIDVPESSSLFKKIYYEIFVRSAVRRANRVFTVSEFSRQRIIAWSGCSEDKVVVAGNGVEPYFQPQVAAWAPGYPYLLCVSNRRPHKNEKRLLEAFARAVIDPSVRLVLTGSATPELEQMLAQSGLGERVVFLGHVDEQALPGLYRGAIALVFPSLYEGFGLPVVEAMACGTPVITSNVTSLPEVAGDAALLVDPLAINEITEAMQRLCSDPDLRASLAQKGILRAAAYSWDEVASRIRLVFEQQATHVQS